MYVIKRNADNLALYVGQELTLSANGATKTVAGQVMRDPLTTTANATLEVAPAGLVPSNFTGEAYALVNGEFTLTPAAEASQQQTAAAALQAAKAVATVTITTNRDLRCYANVTAYDRPWQADKLSRDLLSATLTIAQAGLPLPPEWRDADNLGMAITSVGDLLGIAGAMAAQTQAAYTWSWAKRAAVEAATTMAELQAIDLET